MSRLIKAALALVVGAVVAGAAVPTHGHEVESNAVTSPILAELRHPPIHRESKYGKFSRAGESSLTFGHGEISGAMLPSNDGLRPLDTTFSSDAQLLKEARELLLPIPKDLPGRNAKLTTGGMVLIGDSRSADLAHIPSELRMIELTRSGSVLSGSLVVTSAGAAALRVAIRISGPVDGLVIRVGGRDTSGIFSNATRMPVESGSPIATERAIAWTPVTVGDAQLIEVNAPIHAVLTHVTVEDVSHLWIDPGGVLDDGSGSNDKALSCNVNFSCVTEPTIASVGAAVARLVITTPGGQSGLCSGALLNDRGSTGVPWFATAHHCGIWTQAIASSVQFYWHYERSCSTGALSPSATTSLGAQLLFSEEGPSELTLLRLFGPLPGGLVLLGWDPSDIPRGQIVVGVHHPGGAEKAVSGGRKSGNETITFRTSATSYQQISSHSVSWEVGVTEPGSSGSPLLKDNGSFVGVLSAGPLNATCATATQAFYSKFSIAYPKVRAWLDPAPQVSDDWPNSPAATFSTQPTAFDSTAQIGRLETTTDQDWYRFSFSEAGVWLLGTTDYQGAAANTLGQIFGGDGSTLLAENDDAPVSGFGRHFLFLNRTSPGTYFLRIAGSGGSTGPYTMHSLFAPNDDHSDFFFLGTQLPQGADIAGQISRNGDVDFFVLDVAGQGEVTIVSTGGTDVIGALYDSNFRVIDVNDDIEYPSNLNFRIRRSLPAGRYYLGVLGYDVTTRGSYSIRATGSAGGTTANYTALWWNPNESGWGVNLNHQGNIVFGTLFTYDASGVPLWLVLPAGNLQSGTTYSGELYRTTGPAFNANPFTPIGPGNLTLVGSMSVTFSGSNAATLTYTYNGTQVTKSIQRQVYGSRAANCTPTTASRASAANYQDLWWNANESGWGVNVTHQDNILFATLFTYDATGRDLWLVLPAGTLQPDGSYLGDLYRTTGPPFNANPFTPINAGNLTIVGTMRFRFTNGENGTLTYTYNGTQVTKAITRQVFSSPVPACS